MSVLLRSDFNAFQGLSKSDGRKSRLRETGAGLGIPPGTHTLTINVTRSFLKALDRAINAPENLDARKLRRNEVALEKIRELISEARGSDLKERAAELSAELRGASASDLVKLVFHIPTPLFSHLQALAPRRRLTPSEFLAAALVLMRQDGSRSGA